MPRVITSNLFASSLPTPLLCSAFINPEIRWLDLVYTHHHELIAESDTIAITSPLYLSSSFVLFLSHTPSVTIVVAIRRHAQKALARILMYQKLLPRTFYLVAECWSFDEIHSLRSALHPPQAEGLHRLDASVKFGGCPMRSTFYLNLSAQPSNSSSYTRWMCLRNAYVVFMPI